ncbi:MAG: chemotaxis protein CheC [Pseudomonadota bacterium]
MNDNILLSEEQADFVREMMNIGAGNSVEALSQLLQSPVDVKIPKLDVFPISKKPAVFSDLSQAFAATAMEMVGDIKGYLFSLVPDEQKYDFIELAKKASPGSKDESPVEDLSVLMEVGNILAGVFLGAIHDFCKLNIYQTVPTFKVDMFQSLIDGVFVDISRESARVIMIEVEFLVADKVVKIFFLIIPTAGSLKRLVDSIVKVRELYGIESD